VLATGGALHSGTSPAEREQQRQTLAAEKSAQSGDAQTTILTTTAQTLQGMARDISALAAAVIRNATPQTPPINHAQALGVYRPVG
jgi:glycerate-2-kinase